MQIKDYSNVTITIAPINNKKIKLKLKKQRYICPICKKIATSQVDIVDKHSQTIKEKQI